MECFVDANEEGDAGDAVHFEHAVRIFPFVKSAAGQAAEQFAGVFVT